MTRGYVYTPYIWPSLLTALLLSSLAVYGWRRRDVPGAWLFAAGCLCNAVWVAGSSLEIAAVSAATKIFWVKFQAPWLVFGPTAVTCFLLEYAWPGRWLTRRNLVLLSIAPLLALGLILTNDIHHLFWHGFAVDGSVTELLGLGGWITVAYTYGLTVVNLIVFAWLFLRSSQHRWPVVVMLTGQIVGRVLFLLDITEAIQSSLPLRVLGMAFLFVMLAIALFRFRILDPIPLACQTAIAQMRDGVLVLDPEGRVASLNPAAERILRLPEKQAMGQDVSDLLPAYPEDSLADPVGGELLLSFPEGGLAAGQAGHEVRQYVLEISPLNDWRGLEVGRLLLLRDVTRQKRAQAQILEQQRALATLQERERLARELHDSTGQVLGYVSLQAQAIAQWVREGDLATAAAQLARMASVAKDAHADLRDSILSLRSGAPETWSFLAALERHLAAYEAYYGIRAELILPPDLAEDDVPPAVGVQLVRVIQEALTNARKHSQAGNVRVTCTCEDGQTTIMVVDDGVGFDLAALSPGGQGHFGLDFMAERMAEIGGRMAIQSEPGSGTRVVLELPGKLVQRRQD